jgi:hypothetical protein
MLNQTEDYVRYFGGVSARAVTVQSYTLASEEDRRACLDAIAGAPCSQRITQIDACASILIPRRAITAGGTCNWGTWAGAPACAPGLVCRGASGAACGTCTAAEYADGHPCDYDDDCQGGRCLSTGDGGWACGSPSSQKGVGEPCATFADCRDNLICTYGVDAVCVQWARVGEPCTPERSIFCVRGATCSTEVGTGTCQPLLPDGAACPRGRDPARACLDWCVFPSADAPEGTCGIPPSGPGPCAAYRDDHSLFCPAATYQEAEADAGPYPATCMCRAQRPEGAACDAAVQCLTGLCRSGNCSTPDRAVGDACSEDPECASGRCDTATRRCLEALHCSD